MKLYRQFKDFLKRSYVALLVFYATFLARQLDKSLQCLGKLGALDLTKPLFTLPAPPRPAPEPTLTDVVKSVNRRAVQIPYVPAWVRPSFKDPTKHPGFHGKAMIRTPDGIVDAAATDTPSNKKERP